MEKNANRALEILLQRLEDSKARNPSFSLRAFAQRLDLSSGALSEVLKGKRPLSHAVKKRIAPRLMLSPQEELEFFADDLPAKMRVPEDDSIMLSQDQFHLISDWWYFGLLNLVKTRGFKNQAAWMARRLGIEVETVREAWQRLFRLGFLEQKGKDITRKHPHLKTTDNLMDLSIRKSHIADLPLIEKSIFDVPFELRDNTSCFFVIDKKDIPKAREMIRIFRTQFLNEIGKDTGEEVYKMSIALFPITKITGEQ